MRRPVSFLLLPLALALAGCGAELRSPDMSATEPAAGSAGRQVPASPASPTAGRSNAMPEAAEGSSDLITPVSLEQAGAAAEAFNRKIVRNGEIVLELDDPAEGQRRAGAVAESHGGFVVTSEISQAGASGPTVKITMRVPAERFGQAVEALRAVGSRVVREKVTGQDVTEEYLDLEARIRTKQALEAQFLEILKQARTVSDALQVQTQVSEVRGEIERLEGRRRYLENQSSLSTINVTLQTPSPIVTSTGTGFAGSVKRAFGDAVDTTVAIVLGFIRLLGFLVPVFLLILLPGFYLLRMLFRRVVRPRVAPAPPAPPQG